MSFIDGLSTGLDTTAIIDALLAVERIPADRLLARRARSQEASSQLASIRTSVTNLRNAAADLRLSSGWQRLSATSSNDTVAVDATSGGFTGAITFRVDALASSHVQYSNSVVESLDTNIGEGGTLAEVVATINGDSNLNFVAVAIQTGDGYRVQLAAKEGGADSLIELNTTLFDGLGGAGRGRGGGFTTLTEGSDAQITFDGLNPYSITSSTNTFSDIMPGVNVTVSEVTTEPVTIGAERDFEQIADSIGALVEQFNEIKNTMAAATKVDPALSTQAPLAFNTNVRRSEQGLVRAFVDPVDASALNAPSLVGISLQRDGTLVFDRDKFIDNATNDLDGLTRMFTAPTEDGAEAGVLDRLVAAAEQASDFGTGLLSTAEDTEKARIEAFSTQIEAFEGRFERKEASLRRLYANLEVSIGNLNSQSNWLAGQLGSLSSNQ